MGIEIVGVLCPGEVYWVGGMVLGKEVLGMLFVSPARRLRSCTSEAFRFFGCTRLARTCNEVKDMGSTNRVRLLSGVGEFASGEASKRQQCVDKGVEFAGCLNTAYDITLGIPS